MAETDAQYDTLGQTYERVKYIPTGLCEQATFLSAVGELAGKSVLDVACGTGFYPRLFSERGAERVVGVDSAKEMITHARAIEAEEWRGITYEQYDAGDLPVIGSFDVVTAVWLLGYAEGQRALDHMVRNLVANLSPGGTLAVLYPNPEVDFEFLEHGYQQYGYHMVPGEESHERRSAKVRVPGEQPFEFDTYFWRPGVVEDALGRAGLSNVARHPVVVPDEALAEHGEEFFAKIRTSASFTVRTATAR